MKNTDTNLLNEKKILAEAEKIIKQANEKELKVVKNSISIRKYNFRNINK